MNSKGFDVRFFFKFYSSLDLIRNTLLSIYICNVCDESIRACKSRPCKFHQLNYYLLLDHNFFFSFFAITKTGPWP